ncbi:MAG: hypothetical protein ACP5H2_04530 [Solirubrobacteraceae bacterium]
MLVKHRPPVFTDVSPTPAAGFEHIPGSALTVLSWLTASRVEFVLVGAIARALRFEPAASGPVAIVPAPYARNLDRLARTLTVAQARLRSDHVLLQATNPPREPAIRFTSKMFVRPERWSLRCGQYDLDIEGRPVGAPSYQELVYEAVRVRLSAELSVDVAALEDVQHYDHVRRTGVVPEMTVSRL